LSKAFISVHYSPLIPLSHPKTLLQPHFHLFWNQDRTTLAAEQEDSAKREVNELDVAYWPEGN
jgi:hypothetical protein